MTPERTADRIAQAVRATHHASQLRGVALGIALTLSTGLLIYQWHQMAPAPTQADNNINRNPPGTRAYAWHT